MTGESAQWRLPSFLLAQVVGSLPIGSDQTVTLYSEATDYSMVIHLVSGRTKARLHTMDISYYPEWGAFDPDSMYPATDLGGRLKQVEWAAAKSDPKLAGVYLDGNYAIATDSFRLACVPLVIPNLENPVIVPSGLLAQTLNETSEVQISVVDNMVHIMPDEYSQMKTVIYDVKYPSVSKITTIEFDTEVKLSRDYFTAAMSRVNSFAVGDRIAGFRMFFGAEEIGILMQNSEVGQCGDVIEVPGFAKHSRFEMRFTPQNIIEAVSKSPNDSISLWYNSGTRRGIIRVDGGSGYQAWVMSRQEGKA
jgi:DNA polymerase III sliding clamp (beta) subunit (PCNA family)